MGINAEHFFFFFFFFFCNEIRKQPFYCDVSDSLPATASVEIDTVSFCHILFFLLFASHRPGQRTQLWRARCLPPVAVAKATRRPRPRLCPRFVAATSSLHGLTSTHRSCSTGSRCLFVGKSRRSTFRAATSGPFLRPLLLRLRRQ